MCVCGGGGGGGVQVNEIPYTVTTTYRCNNWASKASPT